MRHFGDIFRLGSGRCEREAVQAQLRPDQPDQEPQAVADGVDLGEVYYQPGYGYGYLAHQWGERVLAVEPSLRAP